MKYEFTIKDIVKDQNIARFHSYRKGYLYYTVIYDTVSYKFPIPLSDCGDATFDREISAITLMRYIRQAMEDGTLVG